MNRNLQNDCYSIALPTQVKMAYPLADIKRFEEDYKIPPSMITPDCDGARPGRL